MLLKKHYFYCLQLGLNVIARFIKIWISFFLYSNMGMATERNVSIIGTGDFGRALGKILLRNKYKVVYGSRKPEMASLSKIDKDLDGARVVSIPECIRESDIIILCISHSAHHQLAPLSGALNGKMLVDVSNYRTSSQKPREFSIGESLQRLFPDANVVKAFNTLSAYRLESDQGGERRLVQICGDSSTARDKVKQLVIDLTLEPVDCGGLVFARQLEAQPHEFFKGWGGATIVTLLLVAVWFGYGMLRFHYLKEKPYKWDRFPTNVVNKCMGSVSISLLALVFLPGCLAGFTQLIHRTKYHRFPSWLDAWMRMRKQLGLYTLLFAAVHSGLSLTILTPAYVSSLFHSQVQTADVINGTVVINTAASRMNWSGETATVLGFFSLATLTLMGLASLPSVGASLNWREWKFIQSYMGWLAMALILAHILVQGLSGSWLGGTPFSKVVQKLKFLSILLPSFVILLKLFLCIPCVDYCLTRIRHGYDRDADCNTYVLDMEQENEKESKAEIIIRNGKIDGRTAGHSNATFDVIEDQRL